MKYSLSSAEKGEEIFPKGRWKKKEKKQRNKVDESIQDNQVTELIQSSAIHMKGSNKDFIVFEKRK